MSTPEGTILKSVLDYLAAEHVLAFRMNTGAMQSEHNGKKRFMRFGTPGMADVLAFPNRRSARGVLINGCSHVLWLEVKSATGKQSALQKSFQAQVEAEGHRYAVVRSIQDVKEALHGS
jgi:hypothetical protein